VKSADIVLQSWENLITTANAERPAGEKIILDIGYKQGIAGFEQLHETAVPRRVSDRSDHRLC